MSERYICFTLFNFSVDVNCSQSQLLVLVYHPPWGLPVEFPVRFHANVSASSSQHPSATYTHPSARHCVRWSRTMSRFNKSTSSTNQKLSKTHFVVITNSRHRSDCSPCNFLWLKIEVHQRNDPRNEDGRLPWNSGACFHVDFYTTRLLAVLRLAISSLMESLPSLNGRKRVKLYCAIRNWLEDLEREESRSRSM